MILSSNLQTLQDSGYGGTTDKRPHNVRSQDPEGGDKENSSPNKRVSIIVIVPRGRGEIKGRAGGSNPRSYSRTVSLEEEQVEFG